MKHIFFLFEMLFLMAVSSAVAQNPFVTHIYTADPSVRVFGDTLYVYPSHDFDDAQWWDMVDWHVFSTTDMNNWTDHGVVLSLDDIDWADKYAWAPDAIERNGKYYFYFPTDKDYIGVAVGEGPVGPFRDPLEKPLISRETPGVKASRDLIDPGVFKDDDGTYYLFFGQNDVNAVVLNEDMVSFDGKVRIIEGTDYFFEAVWVHKYNGKYYMSYSGYLDKDKNPQIHYAMSDHLLGPYEYKGIIFDGVNSHTNHHSIVEYKGQWYFFYHNADLALQNIPKDSEERKYYQWRRSICVDYLYYNEDGTIKKVIPTKEGVAPLD